MLPASLSHPTQGPGYERVWEQCPRRLLLSQAQNLVFPSQALPGEVPHFC